jgi:phosphoribosylglycinamide formyltransferase-1
VRGSRRLAVLASGSGTILDALLSAGLPVELVISDRPCGALDVAAAHRAPSAVLKRTSFGPDFDRVGYTDRLIGALRHARIDVVAMAGFMTVLSPSLFESYGGRVLNTHPSLLPAFPGPHAVRDALARGVKVTGCTVHIATAEMDAGPILAQEAVAVFDGDTEAELHERIKAVERRLYPQVVKEFLV